MNRITVSDLRAVIARLNRTCGTPQDPYTPDADGRLRANIGCWHLSRAYGGFGLHRMVNESGGVSDPFGHHMPARELMNRISAYLRGFEDARRAAA